MVSKGFPGSSHTTQHWLICISHLMINYSQITFNCQASVSQWLHRVMQSDITAVIDLASHWHVSRCCEYLEVKDYLYLFCSLWNLFPLQEKKWDTHLTMSVVAVTSLFSTVFLPYMWALQGYNILRSILFSFFKTCLCACMETRNNEGNWGSKTSSWHD